jgi:hypothetical protein
LFSQLLGDIKKRGYKWQGIEKERLWEIEGIGDFSSSTEMGRRRRKRSDWPTTNVGTGGSFGAAGEGLTGRHPLWGLGAPEKLQEED